MAQHATYKSNIEFLRTRSRDYLRTRQLDLILTRNFEGLTKDQDLELKRVNTVLNQRYPLEVTQ
jgi:hypothetical protein